MRNKVMLIPKVLISDKLSVYIFNMLLVKLGISFCEIAAYNDICKLQILIGNERPDFSSFEDNEELMDMHIRIDGEQIFIFIKYRENGDDYLITSFNKPPFFNELFEQPNFDFDKPESSTDYTIRPKGSC